MGKRFLLQLAMARGVHWRVNLSASPSPYQNLSTVIRALRGSLGDWGARGFLNQALMFLLYRRLFVICEKMERLVQRFQAGRLWRRGPRVAVVPAALVNGESGCRDQQVLPRRFGWLVWLASYQAAGFGCQLRAVLETPEMVALLVAAPQAGRILKPLCRMLAVETSLLRPEVAVEVGVSDEVVAVVRKRVRKPRVPVDWGRIPLPRGVLAAARRQGVRKGG